MASTLTIRTDDALRAALDERAQAEDKTVSELVREILDAALSRRSFGERVDHLRGRLQLRRSGLSAWPRQVRERNWRP
ncbi:MAG: ribbon-helix-helix protein, CopG family [Planctomycetes bacterium]|nr:ribbon-helix-helix protein, CopG family [Planctomycetota bacterium]